MIDLSRPAVEVAPLLLGATIWHGSVGIRLTEVEAYMGTDDAASHAHRGPTPRAGVMFGPPGHVYVYLSYGMHRCVNLVCSPEGTASAVLLRAGRVVAGIDEVRRRRTTGRARPRAGATPAPTRIADARLASGPGNLGQALGAQVEESGAPVLLTTPGWSAQVDDDLQWALEPASHALPAQQGPRVGISRNSEVPWRWWLPDEPTVSGRRRPGAAAT